MSLFQAIQVVYIYYNIFEHSFRPGKKGENTLNDLRRKYIEQIKYQLEQCKDMSLLDLISQLLDESIQKAT